VRQAGHAGCAERVIVAMGEIQLRFGKVLRAMRRGEVAVFKAGESYRPPEAGAYFEVAIKTESPAGQIARRDHPAAKNTIVYEGERFFITRSGSTPGDTRERHSHSQRVEIRINQGPLLRQIIDGKDSPQGTASVVNFRERSFTRSPMSRHGAVEFHSRVQAERSSR